VLHACRKIDQEVARDGELRRELQSVGEAIYEDS
jgi:chromosomal replication initiation ATPase DnaA